MTTKPKNNADFIGLQTFIQRQVHKRFWISDDPDEMVIGYAYLDKQYGAVMELMNAESRFKKIFAPLSPAEQKKQEARIKLIDKRDADYKAVHNGKDRPTNTSHWKKVDNEAMKRQVLFSMLALTLFNPKEAIGLSHKQALRSRIQTLYWVLKANTPNWRKSPVTWINYVVQDTDFDINSDYDAKITSIFWFLGAKESPLLKQDPLYQMLLYPNKDKKVADLAIKYRQMDRLEFVKIRNAWISEMEKKMIYKV